jgi:hypothetical protein
VAETRFVLGTPQRPENADWRKTEPPAGYGSDHYPVVVDLNPSVNTGMNESKRPETSADGK